MSIVILYSAARDFYERGVSKMLKIFPLSDKVLQMVPAAHPKNKDKFTPNQMRGLAEKLMYKPTDSESLDSIQTEWAHYQLETDDGQQLDNNQIAKYWNDSTVNYPCLSNLMRALLTMPHSNAQSERVFSMLKKIYSDQRAGLCKDSINALLCIKMNCSTCCKDTKFSPELLRKLKKAAVSYNTQHLSSS